MIMIAISDVNDDTVLHVLCFCSPSNSKVRLQSCAFNCKEYLTEASNKMTNLLKVKKRVFFARYEH